MWGSFSDELLEQLKQDYAERQAMAIGYPQQSYSDKGDMPCNKPKAETHNGKSHVVKACYPGAPEGGKLIRFGDANMTTAGKPKEGESEEMKARRRSFKARHAKNIARGPQSGAYWANKVKW
jgi:hypothetical protein